MTGRQPEDGIDGSTERPGAVAESPPEVRLPTFLIIGAAKAGTSTLYASLSRHRDVFMPAVKEPHFFSFLAGAPRPEPGFIPADVIAFRTIEEYATLFAPAPSSAKAIGEASTGYLCTRGAAAVIHAHLPDARLIVLLRDPAERAWSDYRMSLQYGYGAGDFDAYAKRNAGLLACGRYARLLRAYLKVFPADQLLILFTEDLAEDPAEVIARVCDHIGVEPLPLPVEARNVGTVQLRMPPETRSALVGYFEADIRELEAITGRDLRHWLG
jgi:hypothetical protein